MIPLNQKYTCNLPQYRSYFRSKADCLETDTKNRLSCFFDKLIETEKIENDRGRQLIKSFSSNMN